MSIVSVKIFNELDNYVANREPHFDDNFVCSNQFSSQKGCKYQWDIVVFLDKFGQLY